MKYQDKIFKCNDGGYYILIRVASMKYMFLSLDVFNRWDNPFIANNDLEFEEICEREGMVLVEDPPMEIFDIMINGIIRRARK